MRNLIFAASALVLIASCGGAEKQPIVVGSKNFTESVILGELVAQQLEAHGCTVQRRLNMGGTFVCDSAMAARSLDAYVEYSGTALTAILKQAPAAQSPERVEAAVRAAYKKRGLDWGARLGFNNTFAMIVRKSDAQRFNLRTISDLAHVAAHFQPGFGYEFVERPDGWQGLTRSYRLSFAKAPSTMDLGLTYKALAAGKVDLIAGNSTDGLIDSLGLVALADNLHYFPPYDAAIVSQTNLDAKCSGAGRALSKLAGTIDDASMRRLNLAVDGTKKDVAEVVKALVKR